MWYIEVGGWWNSTWTADLPQLTRGGGCGVEFRPRQLQCFSVKPCLSSEHTAFISACLPRHYCVIVVSHFVIVVSHCVIVVSRIC